MLLAAMNLTHHPRILLMLCVPPGSSQPYRSQQGVRYRAVTSNAAVRYRTATTIAQQRKMQPTVWWSVQSIARDNAPWRMDRLTWGGWGGWGGGCLGLFTALSMDGNMSSSAARKE